MQLGLTLALPTGKEYRARVRQLIAAAESAAAEEQAEAMGRLRAEYAVRS